MGGKRIIGAAAGAGLVAAAVGAERHRRSHKPTRRERIRGVVIRVLP
ncbi:MAG TPA: hypothetical protein VLN26_13360 [Gaiellaceae bacterium]|nr:hypothetical protein [Gaiellaceae bacterium]